MNDAELAVPTTKIPWGSPIIAAVTFYTRIPVPRTWHLRMTKEALALSGPWLPWVGMIVGVVTGAVYAIAAAPLGDALAAVCALATGMLLTGAFHEDGLADMTDGFGGGWTREDILRIMKDPTHGTYGVLALVVSTLIKGLALMRMGPGNAPLALIAAHTAGRSLAVTFLATHDYARSHGKAQSAAAKLGFRAVLWALLPGALSVALLGGRVALAIVTIFLLLRAMFAALFTKKLQGYTGDCLGGVEQCAEVALLLTCAALMGP